MHNITSRFTLKISTVIYIILQHCKMETLKPYIVLHHPKAASRAKAMGLTQAPWAIKGATKAIVLLCHKRSCQPFRSWQLLKFRP